MGRPFQIQIDFMSGLNTWRCRTRQNHTIHNYLYIFPPRQYTSTSDDGNSAQRIKDYIAIAEWSFDFQRIIVVRNDTFFSYLVHVLINILRAL